MVHSTQQYSGVSVTAHTATSLYTIIHAKLLELDQVGNRVHYNTSHLFTHHLQYISTHMYS
jgi:hypothetical protein